MINVSDLVDVKGRNLTFGGRVKAFLPKNEVVVHFKTPRQPKKRNFCDDCGMHGTLSMNGDSGEVVCMRTGCGHEHGFEERDEVIKTELLVNISEKRWSEKRDEFRRKVADLLQQVACKDNTLFY